MSVLIDSIDVTGLVELENFVLPVQSSVQIANDGTPIVYSKESKVVDITLVGGSDWGWLTSLILGNIKILASVMNATYNLDYEGDVRVVRFKTEDIPVIDAKRLINTSLQTDVDYYNNIIIKLQEV